MKKPDLIGCLEGKFGKKLKEDLDLSTNLYRSLCNQIYVHKKTGYKFSISWRYAGGVIADIRDVGEDYVDFYCSGGENSVFKDAYKLIKKCGWVIRKPTLTEKIDLRKDYRQTIKNLKNSIKKEENLELKMKLENILKIFYK